MEVLNLFFSLVVILQPYQLESLEQKTLCLEQISLSMLYPTQLDYTFPYNDVVVLSVECLSALAHTLRALHAFPSRTDTIAITIGSPFGRCS
jgi:hypothetical protein